ncbi:chitinase [Cordyceps fumosorosea ARSEF 2679]|uniref:chitinase n=1 Tax=Cordyceps fumosorosea (strain ARSEF 2679) TaxID=1081104 RepID=A0A167NDN0_CORFA|nr:chitinase [Cordyceps fumosorosea ARSEF 2679]OAA55438.1 chitinase [Cordyceps fumosorosea ARSEF 2679]
MRVTQYLSVLLAFATTGILGKNVVGYYPSWKKQYIDSMDLSLYTQINFAFAIPARDGSFSFDGDWFLPQVVSSLHSKGVKAVMSIGGWTGSNYFSLILKDATASANMIRNIIRYIQANNLDGVDLDWEYPGRLGDNCNAFDPQADSANYLVFLKKLRSQMDATFGARGKLLTLALRVEPFDGPSGPLKDVSAYAAVVDFGSLMQFDINGGWNNVTGPNAPFNFQPGGPGLQVSFVSSIDAWTAAGWPAAKLNAGYGFYGRATTALVDMRKDPNNQYQPQSNVVPLGDREDAPWYDACAGATANSGTWQWKHLRDQGVLSSPTTASAPWVRQWDSTSQTPWLFNPQTKTFISYDDPQSLKIKADYAASKGLAGAMVWSLNMDSPTNDLLNVIRR